MSGPGLQSIDGRKEPTTGKTNRTDVLLLPPRNTCTGEGPRPCVQVPPSGPSFWQEGIQDGGGLKAKLQWRGAGSPGMTCRALPLAVPRLPTVIPLTVSLSPEALGFHPVCSPAPQALCRSWSLHTVSKKFFPL